MSSNTFQSMRSARKRAQAFVEANRVAVERQMFDRCSDCDCTSADLAEHGNRCPLTCAATKPGDLHETRAEREGSPNAALGYVMAAAVIGMVALVAWAAFVVR